MGNWGPRNFDDDLSRDFLADMLGDWERKVERLLAGEKPLEVEWQDLEPGLATWEVCVMPILEVMIVVAERLQPDYLPSRQVMSGWESRYLAAFDQRRGSDDLPPQFVTDRRAIIERTFARLLELVKQ